MVTMTEKLDALRGLARHIGALPRSRQYANFEQPDPADLHREFPDYEARALAVALDPDAEWYRRVAACTILDMFDVHWRARVPPEQLGPILNRTDPEVWTWRKAVMTRDGFRCVDCGATDKLEVHHIAHWAHAPAARIIVENGKTLCASCHRDHHRVT